MGKVIAMVSAGTFDALDGCRLTHGERVRVRWPDGSETEETVRLDVSEDTSGAHGHLWRFPIHRAYVDVAVRGGIASARLGGSDLEVERANEGGKS